MLIMLLNEELKLIQATINNIATKVIRPNSKQWDKEKQFPKPAIETLAQQGFMGMLVPEKFGGAQTDFISYVLVMEAIAKADAAVSTIVGVHNSVGCLPIVKFGTEKQKQQFLVPLAKGEKLGAFCLSEPQAGSDAQNLKTTAKLSGDHYIINGVKQFVTSGKNADIAIVFAKTDPELGSKGISAFIVPTATPGYQVANLEAKMGQHASEIAQIVFDDLKIPKENLLGKPGEGYKIALSNLECGRLGIGAQAIGMAQEALDLSIQYANEREAFGNKLYSHQAISFKIAEMATQLEAARQLVYHAACLKDAGKRCIKQASMAKLFASEIAERICHHAIDIHGGYGYLQDFAVEKIYRDVRVTSIYEGTSDIQKMIISKELIR